MYSSFVIVIDLFGYRISNNYGAVTNTQYYTEIPILVSISQFYVSMFLLDQEGECDQNYEIILTQAI